MVLYLISYLDRSNISVAALQMNADLGLTNRMYGIGAGLFYMTYVIFEVPSNIILERVGARIWIARIMISWGIVASLIAFIKTPWQLYGMRMLLGAAEAGFTPGIIYYLGQWFPRKNRAVAMSFFYIAAALASMVGLPISGAIMEMHGTLGFAGWRWLFFLEGIPALVFGLITLGYLPNDILKVKWLNVKQKNWLSETIRNEQLPIKNDLNIHGKWIYIFSDPKVWLLSLLWFLQAFGTIGITLFLPQIIKKVSGESNFIVSLLSGLPFLFACIFMYLNGRNSDRLGERRFHFGLPLLMSGILLIVSIHSGILVAYSFLLLSIAFNWSVTPVFWALTTEYLSKGTIAAGSIGLINAVANIAGASLPFLIGYLKDTTNSYDLPLVIVGIALVTDGIIGLSVLKVKFINPKKTTTQGGGNVLGAKP